MKKALTIVSIVYWVIALWVVYPDVTDTKRGIAAGIYGFVIFMTLSCPFIKEDKQ
jgi:hypothetical protein